MKRTLSILLAAVMLIGILAGCGSSSAPASSAPASAAPASSAPASQVPASSAPATPEVTAGGLTRRLTVSPARTSPFSLTLIPAPRLHHHD